MYMIMKHLFKEVRNGFNMKECSDKSHVFLALFNDREWGFQIVSVTGIFIRNFTGTFIESFEELLIGIFTRNFTGNFKTSHFLKRKHLELRYYFKEV